MLKLLVVAALSAITSVAASPDQIPLGLPTDSTIYDNESILPDAYRDDKKLKLYGGLGEDECTVNIADAPSQAHDTYTRRGIYFWAYGTVIEDYCIFWEGKFRYFHL